MPQLNYVIITESHPRASTSILMLSGSKRTPLVGSNPKLPSLGYDHPWPFNRWPYKSSVGIGTGIIWSCKWYGHTAHGKGIHIRHLQYHDRSWCYTQLVTHTSALERVQLVDERPLLNPRQGRQGGDGCRVPVYVAVYEEPFPVAVRVAGVQEPVCLAAAVLIVAGTILDLCDSEDKFQVPKWITNCNSP